MIIDLEQYGSPPKIQGSPQSNCSDTSSKRSGLISDASSYMEVQMLAAESLPGSSQEPEIPQDDFNVEDVQVCSNFSQKFKPFLRQITFMCFGKILFCLAINFVTGCRQRIDSGAKSVGKT